MLLAKEAVTQKVYSQQIQVKQIQYDKIIQRQKLQNQHQPKRKLPKELQLRLHYPIIITPLPTNSALTAKKNFLKNNRKT